MTVAVRPDIDRTQVQPYAVAHLIAEDLTLDEFKPGRFINWIRDQWDDWAGEQGIVEHWRRGKTQDQHDHFAAWLAERWGTGA